MSFINFYIFDSLYEKLVFQTLGYYSFLEKKRNFRRNKSKKPNKQLN